MHPFAIWPPIAGSLACPCDLSTFQTPTDRPSTSASTLGSRLRHGCRETDSPRLPRRSGWLISPHLFSSLHTTSGNQIIPQGRASRSLAKNGGAGQRCPFLPRPDQPSWEKFLEAAKVSKQLQNAIWAATSAGRFLGSDEVAKQLEHQLGRPICRNPRLSSLSPFLPPLRFHALGNMIAIWMK